eukprot:7418314-Pyramimonas_sp.AAC.1
MLFRALGVGTSRAQQLLRPLKHHMPRDQQPFDARLERMRSYARIAERTPVNIGGIFQSRSPNQTAHAEATAGQPANR